MATNFVERARKLVEEHEFLMLSKSWCPDCHYAYKIWDQYGVTDKVHVIEFDKMLDQEEAKALEDAFFTFVERRWVPTIFFHGKVFGTEQDLKDLEAEGRLAEKFKSENLL